MKKKIFLIVIATFSFLSFAFAQDYVFKVLINKGHNEMYANGTWQPIKTGALLKSGDEIKIAENASVALVHKMGDALEEKRSGTYKIDDLEKQVKPGKSVLNKYTDFILTKNSEEEKKNRMQATAAVHRGPQEIMLHMPESRYADVFNNTVYINWEAKIAGPYVVTITNRFGEVLMRSETSETSLKVNLTDSKLGAESDLIIFVGLKSDNIVSDSRLIKKLSGNRLKSIKKSHAELNSALSPESEELNTLIWASYYEQNMLFIDAIASYEQLIQIDPNNEYYRELYDDFLYRNKLKYPN